MAPARGLRYLLGLLAAGLLAASAALAGSPVSTLPAQSAAAGAAHHVSYDANEYLRLVYDLAEPNMEGRGPGTAGINKARDYLVGQFKAAGLEPAFGGSYLQPFEISLGRTAGRQSLSLQQAAGQEVYAGLAGEDFSTMGFSPEGRFAGAAVLVGYGIVHPQAKYDSYARAENDQVRGKVAIAFRFEPQDAAGRSLWARPGGPDGPPWSASASLARKAQWAAARGAVALLVVDPPSQEPNQPLQSAMYGGSQARSKIPVVQISSEVFRRILRAGGAPADDKAMAELQRLADRGQDSPRTLEQVVLRGEATFKPARTTLYNVGAVLGGAGDLADQVVLLGAHYDHVGYGEVGGRGGAGVVHPGADDNASGTAGVVMLARAFQRRLAAGQAPPRRRTLMFVAFSGEERGLLGSYHLARQLAGAGAKAGRLLAMLNLDMIGRLRDGRAYALGADSGDRWRELLSAARQAAGIELRTPSGVPGGSDHAAFYRLAKVPVLHFYTGMHADYHAPTDTPDKINGPGAVKVLAAVDSLAEQLWTGSQTVQYVPPKNAGLTAQTAYLGVAAGSAAEEAQGFSILMVMADSPAEQAGLQEGDLIVRWDDKPINRAKDLFDALAAAKPGQKVTLTVLRDGQSKQLQATLGRRP